MASKYARAGGGNWSADATWSTSSGGAADTTAPTAADDVFLDASSGNVVVDATPVCRSLNSTGYTGALSGTANMSIGDATAGASNIALKFVAGMTVTWSGSITFISTSSTQQSIDFAGKTTGSVTFNASSNGSWQYVGEHTTTGSVTLTDGSLDINGQTCTWGRFSSNNGNSRSLTLGSANITLTTASQTSWDVNNNTGLTLSASSSTITCNNSSQSFTVPSSGQTYGTLVMSGAGTATIQGGSFTNITRTGTAAKTDVLSLNSNITCSGTFTCNGNSSINRVLIQSSTLGTSRTINAATVTVTNSDLRDITGAGAGSWDLSAITGLSGDCGGNSGITFTTAATQTCTMSTNQNWSTSGIWTTRVPLPQDDVSGAGITGGTLTMDMPRMGKDIDMTGASGSPTLTISTSTDVYGSWTMITGITLTASTAVSFMGRGTHTITSAGKNFAASVSWSAFGGTYTLLDAFSASASTCTLTNGTLDANDFNFTCNIFSISGSATRRLDMGNGTWTFNTTSVSTFWSIAFSSGLTLNCELSTMVLANASANLRTFAGAGQTYNILRYTVDASTGGLDITGSNTFSAIHFSDTSNARTLRFTASTTTTFTGAGIVGDGASGRVLTLGSTTAASHTLTKSSGNVDLDWWSISRSTAQGGAGWYAGANSTDGGNNSGWVFTDPPSSGSGGGSASLLASLNIMSVRKL